MILIIGGVYQGKLEYAREHYPEAPVIQCDDMNHELDLPDESCIINALHLFILAQTKAGINTYEYLEQHMSRLQNKIIVCDDISCGVVPISSELRFWRESTGRCLGLISKNSDKVIRLYCGIPSVIK